MLPYIPAMKRQGFTAILDKRKHDYNKLLAGIL